MIELRKDFNSHEVKRVCSVAETVANLLYESIDGCEVIRIAKGDKIKVLETFESITQQNITDGAISIGKIYANILMKNDVALRGAVCETETFCQTITCYHNFLVNKIVAATLIEEVNDIANNKLINNTLLINWTRQEQIDYLVIELLSNPERLSKLDLNNLKTLIAVVSPLGNAQALLIECIKRLVDKLAKASKSARQLNDLLDSLPELPSNEELRIKRLIRDALKTDIECLTNVHDVLGIIGFSIPDDDIVLQKYKSDMILSEIDYHIERATEWELVIAMMRIMDDPDISKHAELVSILELNVKAAVKVDQIIASKVCSSNTTIAELTYIYKYVREYSNLERHIIMRIGLSLAGQAINIEG